RHAGELQVRRRKIGTHWIFRVCQTPPLSSRHAQTRPCCRPWCPPSRHPARQPPPAHLFLRGGLPALHRVHVRRVRPVRRRRLGVLPDAESLASHRRATVGRCF